MLKTSGLQMRFFDSTDTTNEGRRSRNWVAETLVVLGILAFGYFALTMQTQGSPGAALGGIAQSLVPTSR